MLKHVKTDCNNHHNNLSTRSQQQVFGDRSMDGHDDSLVGSHLQICQGQSQLRRWPYQLDLVGGSLCLVSLMVSSNLYFSQKHMKR